MGKPYTDPYPNLPRRKLFRPLHPGETVDATLATPLHPVRLALPPPNATHATALQAELVELRERVTKLELEVATLRIERGEPKPKRDSTSTERSRRRRERLRSTE